MGSCGWGFRAFFFCLLLALAEYDSLLFPRSLWRCKFFRMRISMFTSFSFSLLLILTLLLCCPVPRLFV